MKEKRRIAQPQELEVLSRISKLRSSGYTLREIAVELNRRGYLTPKRTSWQHQYVANALKLAA